jgi:FtsP/CotA-like multicopper oxidase with cupredoxin domain
MSSNSLHRTLFLAALATYLTVLPLAAQNPRAIASNDNRLPAGELRNGVLTIHLEMGEGLWHPQSETGEALRIYAFGEAGGPLQNPGPLIRVSQGTEIQGTVHNALPVSVILHGFHEKPGEEKDAITLQPGATQQIRFKAGAPGTYFYWGATSANGLPQHGTIETQLSGALVIDPPSTISEDRIFVIGLWSKEPIRRTPDEIVTINGKSWPYTEHFTFKVGEPVHWRWLNTSSSDHAMHLHGFYYHVDADGDGEHNRIYSQAERPLVVTKHVNPAETFDMTWVPERSGRWLFHCHMLQHMSPPERSPDANPANAPAHAHDGNSESAGMGGLVLGITVLADKEESKPAEWRAERKLQLRIEERQSGKPLYALEMRDAAQPRAHSQDPYVAPLIGPPIVLTRGQPVEIEVVNHIKQPTAIHWHGIELESFYDGVPGWTGTAEKITPAILPGESFVARMAPPRAGTFIYHTHWHDRTQLENGIYGPLIVLPPGQKFDPNLDKTFVFSMGEFPPFGLLLLVNGSPQPFPLQLKSGTKYRFRLINIAPDNVAMRVSLRQSGVPVQWRAIAKDGADLPPEVATMKSAEMGITIGETYDFEFESRTPAEFSLEVYLPGPKIRTTQALVFTPDRPRD